MSYSQRVQQLYSSSSSPYEYFKKEVKERIEKAALEKEPFVIVKDKRWKDLYETFRSDPDFSDFHRIRNWSDPKIMNNRHEFTVEIYWDMNAYEERMERKRAY